MALSLGIQVVIMFGVVCSMSSYGVSFHALRQVQVQDKGIGHGPEPPTQPDVILRGYRGLLNPDKTVFRLSIRDWWIGDA